MEQWLTEEVLADIQQFWFSTQDDWAVLDEMKRWVPEPVLRYLGRVA